MWIEATYCNNDVVDKDRMNLVECNENEEALRVVVRICPGVGADCVTPHAAADSSLVVNAAVPVQMQFSRVFSTESQQRVFEECGVTTLLDRAMQ